MRRQRLDRQRAAAPLLQTSVPATSTTTRRECLGQGLQDGGSCPLPSAQTDRRQSQDRFPGRAMPRPPSAPFNEVRVSGDVGFGAHTTSVRNCQSVSRNGGAGLPVGIGRDGQKGYMGGESVISVRGREEEEEAMGTVSRSHVHSPGTRTDECRAPRSGIILRHGAGQSRCDSESSAASSLGSEWHSPNDLSFLSIAMYQNSGTASPPGSEMSATFSDRDRQPRTTSPQSLVRSSQVSLTPKPSQRSRRYQPTSPSSEPESFYGNSLSLAVAPLELSRRPSLGVVPTRGDRLNVTGDCAARLHGEEATLEPRVPGDSGLHVRGGGAQGEGGRLSNVSRLADRAQQTQSNKTHCASHIATMAGARRPDAGDDTRPLKKNEGALRSRGALRVFDTTAGDSGSLHAPPAHTSRVTSHLHHRRFRGSRGQSTATPITDDAAAESQRESTGPQSRRPVMSWCSRARVCAVASAPSGELFTGGDPSGAIEVWDSRIGRRLGALRGHVAAVLSLKVLPHSTLLFSGSADRTAQLWDMRTLQSTMVLKGHRGLITALATLHMTNVGLYLFTGSDDGTVRQWQALTGACVHVYQGHRGPVNVVTSLLPDKYIATGGCDGLFKVWNAQTLRCLSSVPAVPSRVSSGALVGHESRVRRQGIGVGQAYRFNDEVGESTATSSNGCVWDIAQLSDSNQSLATATDDGVVRLWATQWNRHAVLLKEICIPDMLLKACSGARCLLACGSYLFVGGAHGELYMWYTAELPHVDSDTRRGVETSSSRIASDGLDPITAPSTVVAPASTETVETYRAAFLFHTAALTGLEREGTQLYSASLDHTVCRWDLRTLVSLSDDALDATSRVRTGAGCVGALYRALDRSPEDGAAFSGREISGGPRLAGFMSNSDVVEAMSSSYSGAWLSGGAGMLLQESRSVGGATDGAGGGGVYTGAVRTQWNAVGCADTVTNLNASETAAVYAQLPLSFVVRQFRAAATSPVEMRSLLRTALLLVYAVFLLLFYALGLAPVSHHSVDVAVGVFSSTATHPLPSFARPQTFRSIRSSEDLARWLILLMEQLHSFQVPVHLSVTRNPNASSVDDTAPLHHVRRSRGKGAAAIFQDTVTCTGSEHAIGGRNESTTKNFVSASDGFSPSSSCSLSASVGLDNGRTRALEDIVGVPAMPGGVVLLTNVRVRVKHVTNTSCTWNRHLLHRRLMSTTPTADTTGGEGANTAYACYGPLDRSTAATDPLCVADRVSASIYGDSASTAASSTAPQQCLPYTSEGAGVSFHGLAGVYDSGGYAVDLAVGLPHPDGPWVSEDLEALLKHQSQFIDGQRTRLVDVLLYTYHIHSQTFVQLHYSLEMPVAGVWLPTTVARSFFMYGADDVPSASATLACVVVALSLLMCLLALVLYNIMLAYRMRELIAYLMSATVLLNLILIVSGMCVVSFMFRWISTSAELKVAQLLQLRATTRNETISRTALSDSFSSLSAPPEMSDVLSRLSDVEAAFRALTTSTAVHAIFLFQEITMVSWRLINFLQVMRVVMQQIRLPLLVGLVLMALSVTGISLTAHSLYGSTQLSYGSPFKAFTHVLLYLGLCQTLDDGVSSPLLAEHRIVGRLLILWVNFIFRLLFYAYLVVLVWERFQAVSSSIPAIPPRARLAKWWLDIRFQLTLMRQSSAPTATSHLIFSSSSMSTATPSSQLQRRRDTTLSRGAAGNTARTIGEGRKGHSPLQSPAMAVSEAANTMTSCVFLFGRGHHASLVEYLWKHLKLIQKHHERTSPPCTGGHLVDDTSARGGSGSQRGSFSHWRSGCPQGQGSDTPASGDPSSPANHMAINRGGKQRRFFPTDNRSGERGYEDAAASVHGGASSVSTAGSDSGSDDGAACFEENPLQLSHPQVRQTDLLLSLPEEARTPFARSVIQHTWSSLTWMYHYDQQHARMHDDAARDRRRRLDQGILRTQDELASLHEIVRAAQARMADHEARLRPLAKAVAAVSRR